MRKRILVLSLLLGLLLFFTSRAQAGTYYFELPQVIVNVFWNADGTLSIDYLFVFKHNPTAGPIDYVDLAMPNSSFDANSIYADVGGKSITDISKSGFQGTGSGVALGLGVNSIKPGQMGQVHAFVGTVERVLYVDPTDKTYASAVFSPMTYGSDICYGTTDFTVVFHLPPGVKPEEPRWHEDKPHPGFPAQPDTSLDSEGRVTYTWRNQSADFNNQYQFGASFPMKYVPDSSIVRKTTFENIFAGIVVAFGVIAPCLFPLLCVGGIAGVVVLSVVSDRKRKLQYLPPKISIEGHGIKRGLTAVEAAILMEQPMDKILTMILFAAVKKNAAEVVTRDPLEIKAIEPQPADLQPYEKDLVAAFQEKGAERRTALQKTMVNLVKTISEKMKGFSRKESVAYYQDIIKRAWAQVEAAGTPDVQMQKYEEVMDWTMLDRDYDRRTRDVFSRGPVFVPLWWGRYDPGYGRQVAVPRAAPSVPSGSPSLPRVPGADFAASIVGGVQSFSSKVVGNITSFTSSITNQTNPAPKPTYSSSSGRSSGGGGGHSCACACACAGCACACAGGGR
jgi:hypothetical protein